MLEGLMCYLRKQHDPVRHPLLSGYRCASCGLALADLGEAAYSDREGYVSPLRKTFARGDAETGTAQSVTREGW